MQNALRSTRRSTAAGGTEQGRSRAYVPIDASWRICVARRRRAMQNALCTSTNLSGQMLPLGHRLFNHFRVSTMGRW